MRDEAFAAGVIILVLLTLGRVAIEVFTKEEVELTVEHKYMYTETRVSSDDDGDVTSWVSRHFVVVDDHGVSYEIGYPIWMPFKSRQALYGGFKEGCFYRVRTVGFRIDWLSHFPRIYSMEEVVIG